MSPSGPEPSHPGSSQRNASRWRSPDDESHGAPEANGPAWCNRAIVVEVRGRQGVVRRRVEKPFAIVGAHPKSDILLPDRSVGKRELYLHATDVGIFAIPLVSGAESATRAHGWIDPLQEIAVGRYSLKCELAPPVSSMRHDLPALDARNTFPEPRAQIVVSRSGRIITVKLLTRIITLVGRSAPCSLRIADESVSGAHCALFWDGKQLWVIDLISGNGTLLHKQPITSVPLQPKESVKIGAFRLTLKPFDANEESYHHDLRTDAEPVVTPIGVAMLEHAGLLLPDEDGADSDVGVNHVSSEAQPLESRRGNVDLGSVSNHRDEDERKRIEQGRHWDEQLASVIAEREKLHDQLTRLEQAQHEWAVEHDELTLLRQKLKGLERELCDKRSFRAADTERLDALQEQFEVESKATELLRNEVESLRAQLEAETAAHAATAALTEQLRHQHADDEVGFKSLADQLVTVSANFQLEQQGRAKDREQFAALLEQSVRDQQLVELLQSEVRLRVGELAQERERFQRENRELLQVKEQLTTSIAALNAAQEQWEAAQSESKLRRAELEQQAELRRVAKSESEERGSLCKELDELREFTESQASQIVEERDRRLESEKSLIASQAEVARLRADVDSMAEAAARREIELQLERSQTALHLEKVGLLQQQLAAVTEKVANKRARIEQLTAQAANDQERHLAMERRAIQLASELAAAQSLGQTLKTESDLHQAELARERERHDQENQKVKAAREQAELERKRGEELIARIEQLSRSLEAEELRVAELTSNLGSSESRLSDHAVESTGSDEFGERLLQRTESRSEPSTQLIDLSRTQAPLVAEHLVSRVPEVMGNLQRLGDIDRRRRRLFTVISSVVFLTIIGALGAALWIYRDKWIPAAAPPPAENSLLKSARGTSSPPRKTP